MFLSCNYPLKFYLNFVVGLNIAASESFFSYIFVTFTDIFSSDYILKFKDGLESPNFLFSPPSQMNECEQSHKVPNNSICNFHINLQTENIFIFYTMLSTLPWSRSIWQNKATQERQQFKIPPLKTHLSNVILSRDMSITVSITSLLLLIQNTFLDPFMHETHMVFHLRDL